MPATSPLAKQLIERIDDRTATIGIVGLGYVGLPLVLVFQQQGFNVIGLDIDPEKTEALMRGESYIEHIPAAGIGEAIASGRFTATVDSERAAECDALLLCIPTPLTRHREPDMTYIEATAERIGPHLKRGCIVSLESTTYPGTTDEVLIPILERLSGMKAGEDFFVAYSPEREDPNNKDYTTSTIPKVVGGHTEEGLEAALTLYNTIVKQTVPVSSTAAAEATKLVENIFRCVNIAMVNELKMVFERMGIDIWEVINAAKTKPFGFMPFYPGPGLGGHCIPIDPFYLTWKAREYDMPTKFIELAGEINTHMPYYVVSRTMDALNISGKALKGSSILLVGLAYKKDVDDLRESPTLKLIELFEARGAEVSYHDPHIPQIKPTREHPEFTGRPSTPLDKAGDFDVVVISTDHSRVDYEKLGQNAKVIVDTRNAMARITNPKATILKA